MIDSLVVSLGIAVLSGGFIYTQIVDRRFRDLEAKKDELKRDLEKLDSAAANALSELKVGDYVSYDFMEHVPMSGAYLRQGKSVIKSAKFDEDFVDIEFEDGVTIRIFDGGQSCCEHRYLTLDDNIEDLVGQTLVHIMEKGYKDESDEESWVEHETCFLEIQGNKSSITFAAHNEHNGYYGGFGMSIKEL